MILIRILASTHPIRSTSASARKLQVDHIGYRSPTFPIKYKYGIKYTQEGDHGLPNSNGPYKFYLEETYPNGYYMPGEPGRPYDYFEKRYYDEDPWCVR